MIERSCLVIPAGFLVWLFCYYVPDWIHWIETSNSYIWWKSIWIFISYGGIVAILACIALLGRRSPIALGVITALAFALTGVFYRGYQNSTGMAMDDYYAFSLFVGMVSSVPVAFSGTFAGKQIDIVGDE